MEDWEKKRLIDESNSKIDEHNRRIEQEKNIIVR